MPKITDNSTTKKRVIWEEKITIDALREKLDKALLSGDSLKLLSIIKKNPSYKLGIKAYLTQTVEDVPVGLLQAFFDKCDENIVKNDSNSPNLSKLLLVLFEEIDFEQTKIAFEEMKKCLKTKGFDYSSEFTRIFDEVVEKYNQELISNTQTKNILKKNKAGDFFTEENEAVEPSNPTKKARIEEHDEHSLTIEQKIEELKAEEEGSSNLGSGSSTNQRAVLGPMTRSLDNHEKKKIHQDDTLVNLNNQDKNSNSVDTNSNAKQKNLPSLHDLVNDFSWLENLPKFIQKMFPHLLASLSESAKYINEVLDIKSNKQDLLSDNQDDSLARSNNDNLEDDISESASLQKDPSDNHIDMSMILDESTVNYDILSIDIGSKIVPDYEMLGLQQNFLHLF